MIPAVPAKISRRGGLLLSTPKTQIHTPQSPATMVKRKVGALEKVEADLPSLQFRCRRDPQSYQDDFQRQYNQYETFRELFLANPTSADDSGIVSLRELIDFIAHCADCCTHFRPHIGSGAFC